MDYSKKIIEQRNQLLEMADWGRERRVHNPLPELEDRGIIGRNFKGKVQSFHMKGGEVRHIITEGDRTRIVYTGGKGDKNTTAEQRNRRRIAEIKARANRK